MSNQEAIEKQRGIIHRQDLGSPNPDATHAHSHLKGRALGRFLPDGVASTDTVCIGPSGLDRARGLTPAALHVGLLVEFEPIEGIRVRVQPAESLFEADLRRQGNLCVGLAAETGRTLRLRHLLPIICCSHVNQDSCAAHFCNFAGASR